MTGDSDSRVDPMHARKMAALMQSVAKRPVLLRVEGRLGMGWGRLFRSGLRNLRTFIRFCGGSWG
ncbi:MAG TPA: hypothetical protein VN310_12615 [Candidatus Dormibacteraeota bacterium]|nr:hypothetical protein [Candidatus Dormibacteraeota bacterium]